MKMIQPFERLRRILRRIDGRGYKAYKEIAGTYRFGDFDVTIEHVQSDPFAPPSRIAAEIELKKLGLPDWSYSTKVARIATADYLLRRLHDRASKFSRKRGSGKSGIYSVLKPGQAVLPRSGCEIIGSKLKIRFGIGLPADGRKIKSEVALHMFFAELPQILSAVKAKDFPLDELKSFVDAVVDQNFIRNSLWKLGLVAFVADGAILPRRSGIDDRPMEKAVRFRSPNSMRITLKLPSGKTVSGIGIPQGVTLIVGGGFHGKSTLLEAIQFGVYDHIPGDGRELVVSLAETVKIRAEDGRYIDNVDISGFIRGLPSGYDTQSFGTEDASGSTSQAANIVEALEIGAKLLLIDEDTSATNFMLRDELMRELIRKEPIVPFIDRAKELFEKFGVSSIIVVGGAGDYLSIADTVILMEEYVPIDATHRAKSIAIKRKYEPRPPFPFKMPKPRKLQTRYLDPYRGKKIKVDAKSLTEITFGRYTIDMSAIEQLVEIGQARAIAKLILYMATKYSGLPLRDMVEKALNDIEMHGFDAIGRVGGGLALPRKFELAAAVNRLRCARFLK